jgi:hypothetical protein
VLLAKTAFGTGRCPGFTLLKNQIRKRKQKFAGDKKWKRRENGK